MKPNTLIIIGIAVAAIYLVNRVTGEQARVAVTNANPIWSRLQDGDLS